MNNDVLMTPSGTCHWRYQPAGYPRPCAAAQRTVRQNREGGHANGGREAGHSRGEELLGLNNEI